MCKVSNGSDGAAVGVGLVLLVHLLLAVLVLGDGGECPRYPVDVSWKESIVEPKTDMQVRMTRTLRVLAGTFEQGSKVLLSKPTFYSNENVVQGVRLVVMSADPSECRDVYKVSVMLTLGFWPKFSLVGLRGGRKRPQGEASQEVTITGDGTFHEKTGELCVLGCINSVCKYKLSLTYPSPKTIHHVSTVGNLSSVVDATDPMFFQPVSIRSFSDGPFQSTMNATIASQCPRLEPDVAVGKLWREEEVCSRKWFSSRHLWASQQVWSRQTFEVSWNPECEGANCTPFAELGKGASGNPASLRFDRMRCDGDRIQGILVVTKFPSPIDPFVDPTATDGILIAEGTWDSKTGKMCMIACHLYGNEDCQIAVTLQFPLIFTITQRSLVVGHIKSLRNETDSSYFKRISFRPVSSGLQVKSFTSVTNQPEYVYTKVETAKIQCALNSKKKSSSSSRYPSGADWRDLEFRGVKDGVKSQIGSFSFVNFNVFTFGNQFRTNAQLHVTAANVTGLGKPQGILNVSYSINYQIENSETYYLMKAGEGIYDPEHGKLCLIGCRTVDSKQKGLDNLEGDAQKDCQIFFSVQLPAIDSQEILKGTVKSLRDADNHLYFKPQSFSRSVPMEILQSVRRVDLEIVISVIMLSLTVVFIILQLIYCSRYPETLPYISTSMLLLLSLSHMIPLVLNFEALFQKKQKDYNMIKRAAGWPEVNEVVVRLTTMAAMLLQLRLLQLVWKSRLKSRATGSLGHAVQERRVLYTILPVYIVGGLIAVLVHSMFDLRPYEREFLWRGNGGGLWWAIKAYGGLLLDFHLFPQVVGNILWGAREQAPLSRPFYFGMALVRSLPHVYDLCRKFRFMPAFSDTYLYANPEWDFYSVTSDVLIPVVILLLATMVYMQQRWGGRCLLPRRWRSSFEYESVDRREDNAVQSISTPN